MFNVINSEGHNEKRSLLNVSSDRLEKPGWNLPPLVYKAIDLSTASEQLELFLWRVTKVL